MTRPTGRAALEITADASKLGPSIEREADRALRAVHLDLKPIADQIVKGVRDGADGTAAPLKKLTTDVDKVFAELADFVDKSLRQAAKDADRSGEEIGDAIKKGAEEAGEAVDKMGVRARDEFGRFIKASEGAGRQAGEGFSESFRRSSDNIDGSVRRAGESITGAFRKIASVVGVAFASIEVGRFFKEATLSAQTLGSAVANTQKIIESTHGAAGLLATDVRNIAQQLSFKIGVDSVDVQNAINVLLTFRSISGPVLQQAIGLAADLSAVFGQDLSGSATQLGKALQDPIRGIAALSRVGVSFSQAQKDQIAGFIATNQLAKAQGVILSEVAQEVGGVAEAGADTTDKLQVAFEELKRDAGEAIIELVDEAGPALLDLAKSIAPAFSAVGTGVASLIRALLPVVGPVLRAFGEAFKDLAPALEPLGESLAEIGRAGAPVFALLGKLGAEVAPLASAVIDLAAPLVGLLVPVLRAMTQVLPPIVSALTEVGSAIVVAVEPAAEALGAVFADAGPLMVQVLTLIAQALVDTAPALFEVISAVAELAPALLELLVPALQLALALLTPLVPLVGPLATALSGPLVGAVLGVSAVLTPLAPLLEGLTSFFTDNPELVYVLVAAIGAYTVATKASAVATAIAAGATDFLTGSVAALDVALGVLTAPVTLIVVGIAALVAGAILAYKHVGWFRAAVDAVGHALVVAGKAVADFAVGAWRAVVGFFSQLGHNLSVSSHAVGDFVDGVGHFFAELPRRIGQFLSDLPSLIGRLLVAAFDKTLVAVGVGLALIFVAVTKLPGLIIDALISLPPKIGRIIVDAIVATAGAVRDGVAALGRILWQAVLHLGQLVIDGWHAAVDFLFSLPGRVAAAVLAIPGLVSGAFHAAVGFVRAEISAMVALIASIPDRIAAFKDRMLRAGVALIQGFMDGFRRIGSFAANLASDIGSAIKGFLNHVINQLNIGIAKVDDALPFSLPRIPPLARGGLTQTSGLAMLHPTEAILPLEDARVTDLLARAMAEAQQGLRAAGVGTFGAPISIRVYLGTREITDIVGVEIDERNRELYQRVTAGPRRAGVP